jgi:hypothetical protein
MERSVKKLLLSILGINGFLFFKCSEAEIAPDSEQAAPYETHTLIDKSDEVIAPTSGLRMISDLQGDLQGVSDSDLREMSQALESKMAPTANGAMVELLNTNVRADSKEPRKFLSDVKLELVKVESNGRRFPKSMNKWWQYEVILSANTEDKTIKYADNCTVKIYIGYNNCRSDGKMLLFKANCTCITLPTNERQSVFFFLPGDVSQRYNLNRDPDHCAIVFSVDGIRQRVIIADSNGKDTRRSDSDEYHRAIKEGAYVEDRTVRNSDQLPSDADIKVGKHPTLRLE